MRIKRTIATIAAAFSILMPFPPVIDSTINVPFYGDTYTTIGNCVYDGDMNLTECYSV